jgi:hypothetical protein
VDAGERRQQGVVAVDVPPGKAPQERRSDELEEARGHHQRRFVCGDSVGERRVPGRSVRVVEHAADEGGDTGSFGPRECLDTVAVGADRGDLHAVGGVGRRVDERLEQRARP